MADWDGSRLDVGKGEPLSVTHQLKSSCSAYGLVRGIPTMLGLYHGKTVRVCATWKHGGHGENMGSIWGYPPHVRVYMSPWRSAFSVRPHTPPSLQLEFQQRAIYFFLPTFLSSKHNGRGKTQPEGAKCQNCWRSACRGATRLGEVVVPATTPAPTQSRIDGSLALQLLFGLEACLVPCSPAPFRVRSLSRGLASIG
jgi:hypothetical protein